MQIFIKNCNLEFVDAAKSASPEIIAIVSQPRKESGALLFKGKCVINSMNSFYANCSTIFKL